MELPEKLEYGVVHLLTLAVRAAFGQLHIENLATHYVDSEQRFWEVFLRGGYGREDRIILLQCLPDKYGAQKLSFQWMFRAGDLMSFQNPIPKRERIAIGEKIFAMQPNGAEVIYAKSRNNPKEVLVCFNSKSSLSDALASLAELDQSGRLRYNVSDGDSVFVQVKPELVKVPV